MLDLEGVDLDDELKSIVGKVREDDPYIKQVRVARNRPNVARVVFDLKSAVKPYVFPLAPAGAYKHRLVLDIYPEKPRDPAARPPAARAGPYRRDGEGAGPRVAARVARGPPTRRSRRPRPSFPW